MINILFNEVKSAPGRIASIDWMRGIVMVIMLIDHTSMAFDSTNGSVAMDSARFPEAALNLYFDQVY